MTKAKVNDVVEFDGIKGKVISVLNNTVIVDTEGFENSFQPEEPKQVLAHDEYKVVNK
ncbi:DUF2187 family protein [Pseudalkalibacillus caeni]|uniref:DUF2187 domain-containing protein n=1 Tax=Exobacillus caeni TaxID=2574798 RepID=A0A5R9F4C2_9BACL|nr:DUF2187 family protein [Pseudalkalibacillus caeni]TLS37250.1 DUF2187 domain-containing protein [Pseudalkalibacillus caeni]